MTHLKSLALLPVFALSLLLSLPTYQIQFEENPSIPLLLYLHSYLKIDLISCPSVINRPEKNLL